MEEGNKREERREGKIIGEREWRIDREGDRGRGKGKLADRGRESRRQTDRLMEGERRKDRQKGRGKVNDIQTNKRKERE